MLLFAKCIHIELFEPHRDRLTSRTAYAANGDVVAPRSQASHALLKTSWDFCEQGQNKFYAPRKAMAQNFSRETSADTYRRLYEAVVT
jgi:hypothetical protein